MTDESHRVVTIELPAGLPDVLVVDDDPDVRAAIEELLAGAGFTVLSASEGSQGFRLAQRSPPRVVILDIQMPVLDGLQFLARRSADSAVAAIPVVVVSSEPVDPDFRHQVSAWLPKPVDASVLLSLISRLVCRDESDDDPLLAVPSGAKGSGR
jgi:CheY-like chemotaxis protein